jgi:hypothetical protein
MITSIVEHLTPNETKRISESYEFNSLDGMVVNQPDIDGEVLYSIEELCKMETPYAQFEVAPSKVKAVLLKSDTGIVQNDLFLFNHIVLGKSKEGGELSVVSGRHRLSALLTICEIVGLDTAVKVKVLIVCYPSEMILARSIAAFNTNRTMTGAERERVMLASSIGGEEPTPCNAIGVTKTKGDCKKFFKQALLTQVMEDVNSEPYTTKLLTYNNLSSVFGYAFDVIISGNPDVFKLLKAGDINTWFSMDYLVSWCLLNNYLDHPGGQTSRNAGQLRDLAYDMVKAYSMKDKGEVEITDKDEYTF